MTLGVLLTIGESFAGLRAAGQEQRFVREYLQRYAQAFDRVVVFSYARERIPLPPGVTLVPNTYHLHRYLYTLLLPFLHARTFRKLSLVRVMQTPGAVPAWIGKRFFGIPYVVTYGYAYEQFARFEGKGLHAFLLHIVLRPLLKAADAVIVTAKERWEELHAQGIRTLTLIPNAVNAETFSTTSHPQGKTFRVLSVGRLERQKNLPLLIDALAASRYRDTIELVLVGSGSLEEALREQVKKFGVHLALYGTVPHQHLPDVYRNADVFALLSVLEGHPKALLEALMAGLPCLVTPPVAEAVGLTADQNAIVVDPARHAVRDALDRLLERRELRQQIGAQARRFAQAHWDIRVTLEKEIALLKAHARPSP